jgi:hypothetical protein
MDLACRQNAKKQICIRAIEKTFEETTGPMRLKWVNKGPVPRLLDCCYCCCCCCCCCFDDDDEDDDEDDNDDGMMMKQKCKNMPSLQTELFQSVRDVFITALPHLSSLLRSLYESET